MGVNTSKERPRKIARVIQEKYRDVVKFLLLGAADAGKSTIIKQMRILHKDGFGDEEVKQQKSLIIENIIHSVAAVIQVMRKLSLPFNDEKSEAEANHILSLAAKWGGDKFPTDVDWACIRLLWADGGVQQCYGRTNRYHFPSSTKYFCDGIDRISADDYTPTVQDMLHARAQTTGIVEVEFTLRELTVKVIDVGGQRAQRKKWVNCMENINGIIYVAALSDYNETVDEDSHLNRLVDSVHLFSTILSYPSLQNCSIVLFLNKKDLLAEKLKVCSLSYTFPSYKGGSNYEEACSYIEKLFRRQNIDLSRTIYTHKTCATDTKSIEFVLDATFDVLLKSRLMRSGLL